MGKGLVNNAGQETKELEELEQRLVELGFLGGSAPQPHDCQSHASESEKAMDECFGPC